MQLLESDARCGIALGGFCGHVLDGIPVRMDVEKARQAIELRASARFIADHEHTIYALVQRILDQEEVLLRTARSQRTHVELLRDADLRLVDAEGLGLRS